MLRLQYDGDDDVVVHAFLTTLSRKIHICTPVGDGCAARLDCQ